MGIANFVKIISKFNIEKYYVIKPNDVQGGIFAQAGWVSKKQAFAYIGDEVWNDPVDINIELGKCDYKKIINGKSTKVSVFIIEGEWKTEVDETKPGYGKLKIDKELSDARSSW